MVSNAMRQLEERHMANKIDLVVWSHKMDLLALSNSKGEVCLHRLNWQKAWSLGPPAEDLIVKGIAWRPDGKVIAIGYSNGDVLLVNVENKEVIPGKCADSGFSISLLVWVEDKEEIVKSSEEIDTSSVYLPKLSPVSRSFGALTDETNEEYEDSHLVQDQVSLNFLLIGDSSGKLTVNVFGHLPCGTLHIPEELVSSGHMVSAEFSSDLNHLYVIVQTEDTLKLVVYNSSIIAKYRLQIHFLAYKNGILLSLIDYLDEAMVAINEAYENMLLLEMESKLSKYAEMNAEYSVSAGLLEYLVFGTRSEQLEMFLLNDLTEKGMRKVSRSIELSHCNIQKLILKHLQSVSLNIMYHLLEFRGMSRMSDCYKVLGLDESTVVKAYKATGAFLLKANELLLVVDNSLKKYKAFSGWIESLFKKLQDDKSVFGSSLDEYHSLTQQETQSIAEYIYSLDSRKQPNKQYCLDLVGQYLQNENLIEVVSSSAYPWECLIKNTWLHKNDSIIIRNEKMSLVQQRTELEEAMGALIKVADSALSSEPLWVGDIGSITPTCKVSTIVSPVGLNVAFTIPEGVCIVNTPSSSITSGAPSIQSSKAHFGSGTSALKVIDLQFYLDCTLSLLLEDSTPERSAFFLQLPISSIQGEGVVDACSNLEPGALRHIENMVGAQLAVSGARKVGVILSESRHKVRTYEMEVEEDEEDDEEEMEHTSTPQLSSVNNSLEQSI